MVAWNERCLLCNIKTLESSIIYRSSNDKHNIVSQEQQYISISTGPLTGIPLLGANVWELQGYDAIRGETYNAYGTGAFGAMLKFAGINRIVLYGSASKLSYILVDRQGCYVKDYDSCSSIREFQSLLDGELGDTPYAVIMNTDNGLISQGLITESTGFNSIFSRHNIGAIVVKSEGRMQIKEPEKVLSNAIKINQRWRATQLEGGNNRCFACHGRCKRLLNKNSETICEEQLELFIALGLCPNIVGHGALISIDEVRDFLEQTTGRSYSVENLWNYGRLIVEQKRISRGLGGSM